MSDSPQSPPKDVDQGAQSPDEEGQMNDNQEPHSAGGTGYEFEGVKEQDRWLPIANGMSSSSPLQRHSRIMIACRMCVSCSLFSASHISYASPFVS